MNLVKEGLPVILHEGRGYYTVKKWIITLLHIHSSNIDWSAVILLTRVESEIKVPHNPIFYLSKVVV